MENIVLVAHLLTALAIIGLIMLQQGKGAEMGASFGAGASQTLFGSVGAGNFFSRMTAIFATIFFVTSFSLAVMAKQKTVVDDVALPALESISNFAEDTEIPVIVDEAVEEGGLPSVDTVAPAADEEVPAAPVE